MFPFLTQIKADQYECRLIRFCLRDHRLFFFEELSMVRITGPMTSRSASSNPPESRRVIKTDVLIRITLFRISAECMYYSRQIQLLRLNGEDYTEKL